MVSSMQRSGAACKRWRRDVTAQSGGLVFDISDLESKAKETGQMENSKSFGKITDCRLTRSS